MARKKVTLQELFAMLDSEYRRVRPPDCKSCVAPFPVRRTPPDEVSANWFITGPEQCPHHCSTLLAEIATRLMSEYDLERTPPPRSR